MHLRRRARAVLLFLSIPLSAACGGRSDDLPSSTLPTSAVGAPAPGVCGFPDLSASAPVPIATSLATTTTLASSDLALSALALDEANVYFADTDGTSGTVRVVSKDGSDLKVLADGQDSPASLAVALNRVFWTTPISIIAYPISWNPPGAGPSLTYPLENWGGHGGVVSDGTSFFAEGAEPSGDITISMFPNALLINAGAYTEIPLGTVSGLSALAVDDSYVYYSRGPTALAIARRPKTVDAAEEVLTTDVPAAVLSTMLTVDDQCAYYLDTSSGDVRAVPKAGGTSIAIARGLAAPTSVAVSAEGAWLTTQGGDVLSIARSTGAVTRRAAGGAAQAILVDATGFYWIASAAAGGGSVQRGTK